MKNKGFTLIELLVVIAIIAILAAILFPVFGRAKASAKASVCLSNQGQLARAMNMYLSDFDDVVPLCEVMGPNSAGWVQSGHMPNMPPCSTMWGGLDLCSIADPTIGTLWPYVKSKAVYHCPMDQSGIYKFTGQSVSSNDQWVTYTMNIFVSGLSMSQVAFPSSTALFVDEDVTTRNNGSFVPCWGPNANWSCSELADEFGLQHSEGANISFTDTHAKRRPRTEFSANSPAHKIWFPNRPQE
jgi:prepilin-type N-terminal cleavage/methylation domain-containing protein/prepilin-type processing-associated H-X9-DG protein